MKVLRTYDEIVDDWMDWEPLFHYNIFAELDELRGITHEPDDEFELESTLVIALNGTPDTGFALVVFGHHIKNDAPRTVFEKKQDAEKEALRLFQRRKNLEYLNMLVLIQLHGLLADMRSIDESNLKNRALHRRRVAEMARDVRIVREMICPPAKLT